MSVFVLDRNGKPLMPCSEKRARLLLARGRARIHRVVPFVRRLLDRQVADCQFQPLQVKLDPGSKATGIALVREKDDGLAVLNLFELTREKSAKGFRTGDFVRADVPAGKKAGIHIGRVAIRCTGSFNIQTGSAVVQGVSHRHCRVVQRADGYGYVQSAPVISSTSTTRNRLPPPAEAQGYPAAEKL